MIRSLTGRLAFLLIAALLAGQSLAHAPDQSYIFLDVLEDRIDGRVEISMTDLNKAMGTDFPEDDTATLAQIEPHLDRIRDYVRERVVLAVDGGAPSLPLTDYDLTSDFAQYLSLHFSFDNLPQRAETMDVRFEVLFDTHPDHRNLVIIQNNWKTATFNEETNIVLTFSPGSREQTLDLEKGSIWQGFGGMVASGVHHIFIGIDHILFLLALLLPAVVFRRDGAWRPVESFKDAILYVVKVVTVFTVAHTITLSLAALGVISLSSRLVESIIAFSIAIAALNILVPVFRDRIWIVVFAFGLFHGFGFASVLGDVGIQAQYLAQAILGFNVGVELGQLAIVAVIFPVLYIIRRTRLYIGMLLPAGALALIAISLYWFTERAFEVDLPAGAIVNAIVDKIS